MGCRKDGDARLPNPCDGGARAGSSGIPADRRSRGGASSGKRAGGRGRNRGFFFFFSVDETVLPATSPPQRPTGVRSSTAGCVSQRLISGDVDERRLPADRRAIQELIISGGFNASPAKRRRLRALPGVSTSAVVRRGGRGVGERVTAFSGLADRPSADDTSRRGTASGWVGYKADPHRRWERIRGDPAQTDGQGCRRRRVWSASPGAGKP